MNEMYQVNQRRRTAQPDRAGPRRLTGRIRQTGRRLDRVRSGRTARRVMPVVAALAATAVLLTLAVAPARADTTANPTGGPCDTGRLCLWSEPDFKGARHTYELIVTGTGSCVPLPKGSTAEALANRMDRPVTTYQSAECAETGEFDTYPGYGTWVPQSPYQVRAFQAWER